MKKMKKLWGITVLLAAAMLLLACGKKEEEQRLLGVDGYVYVPKEVQGCAALDSSGYQWGFNAGGGYLYYLTGDASIYRVPIGEQMDLEAGEQVVSEASLKNNEEHIITAYTVDEEQNLYYCARSLFRTDYTLYRRSGDGELVYRTVLEGESDGGTVYTYSEPVLAVDGEENVYMLSADSLLRIDSQGNLTGKLSLEESLPEGWINNTNYLLAAPDGRVYFFADFDSSRKIYQVMEGDEPRLTEAADLGEEGFFSSFYKGPEGLMVMKGDGFLYRYDPEAETEEKALCWEDSDIYEGNVRAIVPVGEGSFFVFAQAGYTGGEWEGFLLSRTPVEELPEKEQIVLASLRPSEDLKAAVVAFNRTSSQYHVAIENYGAGEADMDAARTRLDSSLTTEGRPALLDLWGLDINKYAALNVLEDLYGYMGEDSGIRKEDFMPNLLEGYTLDGKLICVPQSFTARLAISRDPRLAEAEDWTMESLMALADKYPQTTLFPAVSDSLYPVMTWDILYSDYYLEKYVDWEKGECSFDSDDFCRLLEWLKEQRNSNAEDCLLETQYFQNFNSWESVLIEKGRDTRLYGFPSADGYMVYRGEPGNGVAMTADSGHQEGAWAFLQYYLQNGYRITQGVVVFPTRLDQLEERAKEIMGPRYVYDVDGEILKDSDGNYVIMPNQHWVNGEQIEAPYMSQDEADILLKALENIDFTPRSAREEIVIAIVSEETEAFFKGDKSAEETAGIIQNRVSLLLQENQQE